MITEMIDRRYDAELDVRFLSYLPPRTAAAVRALDVARVDEIRLRCGMRTTITADGKNISVSGELTRREIDETVRNMCDGSLYAHSDTICRGYITLGGGIRVGICGRAVTENGRVIGVYDISSLCIRIPHAAPNVGEPVCRLLRADPTHGVLVCSPPGVGKTTLLRAVIKKLSGGADPWRVAVIDTRGELSCCLDRGLCADILSGYPRGQGIEIAARSFNPQLIVCDEIGSDMAEAEAICSAHGCGVPLLATAHASDAPSLMSKPAAALLHRAGIFGSYAAISRGGEGGDYRYEITSADAF